MRLLPFILLCAATADVNAQGKRKPGPLAASEPANTTIERYRAPYPRSEVITGVVFKDSSARTLAPGSDIWPITWAADGNLYTAWGDGGGFGGTNSDGRVSFGIARIEGGRTDYSGFNIAGGKNAPHPPPFPGKSEGLLAIGDTLYLWREGKASDNANFSSSELYRSDDLGATWRSTGVDFSRNKGAFPAGDEGFFALAFCQFGRGYTGTPDSFVYIYAPDVIDPTHWNVRKPGRVNLLRVPRERIEKRQAYQFYAGLDGAGKPRWTASIAERKPVWQDPINGAHRMAVSYNPGLKRYLLTNVTVNRSGWMTIYDAPQPWGPWTLVHVEHNPERWGTWTILFTFVNKWLSADGRQFVIVHTRDDTWSTIEGTFLVADR